MVMAASIYIGTSGYSYADWVGPFYPVGTKAHDFLRIYSSHFRMVELNFSYYRQPEASMLGRMVETTPDGFLFTIKAHKSVTHEISEDWRRDVATFRGGIAPLEESKRLCGVLMQFPYSFHYTPDNRRYLDAVCTEMGDIPLIVEFRNSEWQRKQVYAGLQRRHIATTVADYPHIAKLPKAEAVITSDLGYVRFHGRNEANWWKGDNASRYDYLYSDSELDEWLGKIDQMSRNSHVLVLVFNNHWRGQAVNNADQLATLLQNRDGMTIEAE
jgi:uncharacterized protein YecE (DUF72 family)